MFSDDNRSDEKPETSLVDIFRHAESEEGIYQSYFKMEFWSLEEFAALAAGITPELFLSTEHTKELVLTKNQKKQVQLAFEIVHSFLRYFKEHPEESVMFIKGSPYMTPWRFIKWMSMNQIAARGRFFLSLPMSLLEVCQEFQPLDTAIRTTSKFCTRHHKALYLKRARQLISSSPRRLSRDEIYHDPSMMSLLRSFKKDSGKFANYKKRTVTDSWLKEIDPCVRGRPKKNPAQ